MRYQLTFSGPGLLLILFVCCCTKEQKQNKPAAPAGDYFPLSNNSYWNYIPANDVTALSVFGKIETTKTIEGKTYTLLNYMPGNSRIGNFWDSSLFRKEDGRYYQAITKQQLMFPLDEPGFFEFVFMEDNAPAGTILSSTVSGTYTISNGSMRMDQTYKAIVTEYVPSFEMDSTHSFSDVVKVTLSMNAKGYGPNNEIVINTSEVYDKWYARNKGLIKIIQYSYPWAVKVSDFQVY